jgi:hypothetical protein
MKKIIALSGFFILIAVASFAQRGPGDRGGRKGSFNRTEKFELRKDMARVNIAQRGARRDGIVTPFEKRRIHKAKCNTRRDAFRFKHNGRR